MDKGCQMRVRRKRSGIAALAMLSALTGAIIATGSACIYHADDPCSPGEVQDPGTGECVCAPNAIPIARPITVLQPHPGDQPLVAMCVPCGAHEQIAAGACVCVAGYVKGTSGCVLSNLGAACVSDGDCLDGDANHCQLGMGGATGYCTTTACASNGDCQGANYACVTGASGAYCRRPPLNEGNACTTQTIDPACGAEAPLCLLGHCTLIGCAGDGDCSPSRKCCDLSKFQAGAPPACLETCL